MKKILLILTFVAFLASCWATNNNSNTASTSVTDTAQVGNISDNAPSAGEIKKIDYISEDSTTSSDQPIIVSVESTDSVSIGESNALLD